MNQSAIKLLEKENFAMKIKYMCTLWGSMEAQPEEIVDKALKAGYDGFEINFPDDETYTNSMLKIIGDNNADLIAQQFLLMPNLSVDEYRARLKNRLEVLAAYKPKFINSHTGSDCFSFEDNCKVIDDCYDFTKKTGVKVLHETHRARFPFHTYSLLPYLDKYENLELNADFSHFCVVADNLLENQEDFLEKIIPHCSYIHSRVGYSQSAQVNHPFAPEWESILDKFVGWWQKILDVARSKGQDTFYICPEFGPAPYMPALPFTQQLVADQWSINEQMMNYLKGRLK